jgi:CheY-like chemotaxis protein
MELVVPKRILVIDDEANVRIVVRTCLEILGEWEVLLAASGYEGLFLAQTERPDAILLDVMMPRMDGVAFVRELQANPELRAIPVVFLTAQADLTQPREFQALGVKGAIAKPFNPLTLHEQIATSLGWEKTVASIFPLTRASN